MKRVLKPKEETAAITVAAAATTAAVVVTTGTDTRKRQKRIYIGKRLPQTGQSFGFL